MKGKMEEGDDPEARDTIDTVVQNSAATTIAITYSPPNATNKSDISNLQTPTLAKPHVQHSQ